MSKKQSQINHIYSRHPVLGELCRESEDSFESYNYNAALACLFVLLEASLKYGLELEDNDRSGLAKVLKKGKESGFLDSVEYEEMNQLRVLRNLLFHSDPYAQVLTIGDLLYPLYESDTKIILYERFAPIVFTITEKAVKVT